MSTDEIPCCPECDSPSILVNSTQRPEGPPARADWLCKGCGASFDAPRRRKRRSTADTRSGLSRRLVAADPDDVGGGGA